MKELLAKGKTWLKENWMYAVGGVATIGAIGLAVWKGVKPDDSVIDPFVIDKGKDDWMDQLKTPFRVKGNPLTVAQTLAVARYDSLEREKLIDRGILTTELQCDICDELEADPGNKYMFEVLDGIEGFWKHIDTNTEEVKGA